MAYRLIGQARQEWGEFASIEAAKREVPAVTDWQTDETGFRWNGWLSGAEPFSDPAFVIELVPG